jgi:DNA-binding transcriptional MocR family regulator
MHQTIGPGLRLGYFICNPLFAERLVRATEVVTQSPSGLSQVSFFLNVILARLLINHIRLLSLSFCKPGVRAVSYLG